MVEALRGSSSRWGSSSMKGFALRKWGERARELGLEAVAKQIEVAVERMAACGEALAAALKELEEG